MDGGASWAAVHGVPKSQTRLSDFTLTFHFHTVEEEMATHSSVLAWRIPGMEEPGGLPSMGSHRVRHDWSNLAAAKAWCYEVFWFHSFTCSCPIFPVPFIEEAVFAPWYILVSFVKNKVPIGAWVYSWASYLVPLVCFCASTTLSWWL